MNARVIALGLEAKYQTDFRQEDIALTPKIGIGLMGIVNLFMASIFLPGTGSFQILGTTNFLLCVT